MRQVTVGYRASFPSPSARTAMATMVSRRAISEKRAEPTLRGEVFPLASGTAFCRSRVRWPASRPARQEKTAGPSVASQRRKCYRNMRLRRALLRVFGQRRASVRGCREGLRHAGWPIPLQLTDVDFQINECRCGASRRTKAEPWLPLALTATELQACRLTPAAIAPRCRRWRPRRQQRPACVPTECRRYRPRRGPRAPTSRRWYTARSLHC